MSLGMIGRKVGMTRIFNDSGDSQPVTVVDVSDNYITQIKSHEIDGYLAVQVSAGKRRASRVNKPAAGHYRKAAVEAGTLLKEFRIEAGEADNLKSGLELDVGMFNIAQMVDVTGISIGKGYAGGIKRHNFRSNRASHGNSKAHNLLGSIGMAQDPGRVFPGKKMSGHMGAVRCTVQNLEILRIDAERKLLLIKGAIPGAKGGNILVRPSVKGSGTNAESEKNKKVGA